MNSTRILIVDDHEAVRSSLRSLLASRSGWIVCGEAVDGVEAVEKAALLRPDVILMDVSMPNMDGVEATRFIRNANPEIEVIIISQNDPGLMQEAAVHVGARAFIEKSKLVHDLFGTLEALSGNGTGKTNGSSSAQPGTAAAMVIPAVSKVAGDERERNLQLQAELLAAIVNSSDDAIISKNLDGIITSWNKSAERIFGYTAAEAVGKNITIIIPPDRRQEETEIISRLRRGERIDHFETVRVSKKGEPLNVSLTISPVKDSAGRVIGASKVARDITERKRAEERERQAIAAVVAATAKFKAVFEQTTVFAGIMTKDGMLIEANRLCLDVCGYRADEVLNKPFWDGGWWKNSSESREKIRAATPLAAQGICYRETLHYSWADGTERLVDFALYPIMNDDGEVLFLHPTGVDVTDLKRAEEKYRRLVESLDAEVRARTSELEKRNQDVSRQTELLREFSQRLLRTQDEERRHIARELHDSAGQTLTVLSMSLTQLVQKMSRLAPELASDAEMIEETVRQLHREIRTTSYLLHPPLLDETGLASALNWYVKGLVERSGLDISVDISQDIGRLPREMELVVFRIVQECLTNIHRHSASKTASIAVTRDSEGVTVEIRDHGKGMSRGKLAEIQSGRAGVGIRGMRERLRQFDGNFKIESDGSGTRIYVTLPVPSTAAHDVSPLQSAV